MSKLNDTKLLKFGKFATRIIEIICWMGVAVTLFCAIACLIDVSWADRHLLADSDVVFNGVTVATTDGAHQINILGILAALLGGCVCLVLMALMFRTLCNILTSAETGSPFQPENVKRIERIGWLAISAPVAGFLISLVCKWLGGAENVDVSFGLTDMVMGVLVLILSQFFAYGVKLENDVDGLV